MTDRLALAAEEFARAKHAGLVDKVGAPYVDHLARVTARLPDRLKPVGWLHDVLEDTDTTADDLRTAGFDAETVRLVSAVTRDSRERNYETYIGRVIAAGADAVTVKLADIADNTDPARRGGLDPKDAARLARKYARAKELLEDAARKFESG